MKTTHKLRRNGLLTLPLHMWPGCLQVESSQRSQLQTKVTLRLDEGNVKTEQSARFLGDPLSLWSPHVWLIQAGRPSIRSRFLSPCYLALVLVRHTNCAFASKRNPHLLLVCISVTLGIVVIFEWQQQSCATRGSSDKSTPLTRMTIDKYYGKAFTFPGKKCWLMLRNYWKDEVIQYTLPRSLSALHLI